MNTLIFDLDGTLIHTPHVVIPAYQRTIQHFAHLSMPSTETMLSTFGLPDVQIWQTLMPDAQPNVRQEASELAEEYIRDGLLDTDVLIDNAVNVLETLAARGYILTIASNCGTLYLDTVLDSQGIRPFFERPLCLESVQGLRKADILSEHFRHFSKEGAYMIGDRSSDIEAALFHHIPAIGCNFGFGSRNELQGAVAIVSSLPALLDIFM